MKLMEVLDVFVGDGGFSKPFRDRGHKVTTLDYNPGFAPDIKANWMRISNDDPRLQGFDAVLASPPCECYSMAAVYHHWPGGIPDEKTQDSIRLVLKLIHFIADSDPQFYVIENPRAMLRTVIGLPKETVFLCSFGDTRMKPTDLWGGYPGLIARPCAPHTPAPRGSRAPGSTQGIRRISDRAYLPYALGEELCKRMEKAL